LKLLVLFLKAHASKSIPTKQTNQFVQNSKHLYDCLAKMRMENNKDVKMNGVLDHILKQFALISDDKFTCIAKPNSTETHENTISP
jgi:hypothetical protein